MPFSLSAPHNPFVSHFYDPLKLFKGELALSPFQKTYLLEETALTVPRFSAIFLPRTVRTASC